LWWLVACLFISKSNHTKPNIITEYYKHTVILSLNASGIDVDFVPER